MEGRGPQAVTQEFTEREVLIGRESTADFQVPLSTVSRRHARISETDQVYLLEDLGSTHGTVLNGRRLESGEKKVLRDGDVIELTKAKVTCDIELEKLVSADPNEGTQAIAARAVQGILGRLGEAQSEGPYFRILTGADEGKRFSLGGGVTEWTMGRAKDCELVLNDPNVSRRHALVKKDWNGFIVEDLGSKNGVLIGDNKINKARRLKDRDEITVGPVKLLFIDPDAELMAALKGVPGFDYEDSDLQALDQDASHMGAPDSELAEQAASLDEQVAYETMDSGAAEEGAWGAESQIEDSAGVALGWGSEEEGASDEAEDNFDSIDPALLTSEARGAKDFLVLGGVLVLILATVLLLTAILV
tara:strand:+ start:235 stop:1317 length:1083 start_codon:yes stop_codon:yes gene_type:complete